MIWHIHNYPFLSSFLYFFLTFISIMARPRKSRRLDRSIKTTDIDFNPCSYAVQVKSKYDQDGNPIIYPIKMEKRD